ncbi:AfsR/SARP family transcriptional regulator [Paractinoplanes abujensis]|uniref:DNA-binding SARP family transcriptional activator n=1 Tax=Paractinoplanes abujensis TaxID=882441 RepID=A0A7W7G513_9ACTN|nr:AfsR/SARP family transcriptional regulator [Actinoplanes abujensis]MBB4696472.1 DNA-binding SARP family transcriptional activator [Actinoplanes abujensis]
MLLLHAGRVLSVAVLADAVWGADPPATAKGQLQTCVSRLRRLLPEGAIRSDPAGYCLTPGPGELDAAEFTRLVTEARARQDAELYRRALDLWHGDAAAGIDSHGVRLAADVLDQQHVAALEEWAELELATGRDRDLAGPLSAAVDRFPLQERLSGQLMRALFRSGRQAAALAEYRRVRAALRDDLGLDPGPELQDLHTSMLAGAVPLSPGQTPIRCLPRTVGDFTGRDELVRRLVGAIDTAGDAGPVIAVIDGMAGSGKTTLALHVATLLGDRYPDAHLFVDLRGHHAEQPLDPGAALLVLLRQLGVDSERIPPGLVDRIGLWRTELARRRALVLFDNAATSAQLADLMPTGPGSLALVTSRRRLVGLDGVHPESLPVLQPVEAVALLTRIAGERVRAEPVAAAEVVRRCGGLPLALRLAGARLAHRPRWGVADLVRRLGDSVLPELEAEDRSVVDAFAVSYRQLPDGLRRVFRLLGLCPAGFDVLTVAALTGLSLPDAREALDDLIDVHLIDEPEPDVYRLHDLLREYAAALASEIAREERVEALRGMLDLQLQAAAATNLPTYRSAVERDIGRLTPLRPDLLDAVIDPVARLEKERPYLRDYVDIAAGEPELIDYAWRLPRAGWRRLFMHGYLDDVYVMNERALTAVRRAGNRPAVATILNYLASVHYRRSQLDDAVRLLQECIAIRRTLPDKDSLARAMANLATLYCESGRWAECIELTFEVRRLAAARHGRDEINALANVYFHQGRWPEALRLYRLRLLNHLDIGDRTRIADSLFSLAVIKHASGLVSAAAARRQVQAALRLLQQENYPHGEATAQHELGLLLAVDELWPEAIAALRRAVEIAEQLDDRGREAMYCTGLGRALRHVGDRPAARMMLERGLRMAERSRQPYPLALARAGLGDDLIDDDPAEARRLLRLARESLAALSARQLPDVEASLALLEAVRA